MQNSTARSHARRFEDAGVTIDTPCMLFMPLPLSDNPEARGKPRFTRRRGFAEKAARGDHSENDLYAC